MPIARMSQAASCSTCAFLASAASTSSASWAIPAINCPIIFISGHGDIPMTVRAIKAGAIEFLTKPFRDQELLDAVQAGVALDRVTAAAGGGNRGPPRAVEDPERARA